MTDNGSSLTLSNRRGRRPNGLCVHSLDEVIKMKEDPHTTVRGKRERESKSEREGERERETNSELIILD
ncbi:hypothetical protein EYF80_009758 [Liparis tanakae]|uniref:Uncharacterized protein n=1 Tax=Liparis tanakae TaxID=230148 RepID=A0A4Z2IQ31_9TELE|nr:hypothetical protein EYF80_009758 [Liparis tanakae]